MKQRKSHLSRLAAHAKALLQKEVAQQYGALCIRTGHDGKIEVLLITTRETGRWCIPKGWPIKGLRPHEVAEREAWEEAGVKGKAARKPLGYYTYLKRLPGGEQAPATVTVHLLNTARSFHKFPEWKERISEWVSPIEASRRVSEPELKGILLGLHGAEKAPPDDK